MGTLSISTTFIGAEDLQPFTNEAGKVRLTPTARKNITRSNENLNHLLNTGEKMYGVNTGLGKLSQVSISEKDQRKLQLNLVRSHAAGVGGPFDAGITRLIMILKLMTFAKGFSGIRLALANQLVHFINHDILPIIPKQGSVGASGDLAPLAHLTLGLIGEGNVQFQDRTMSAMVALKEVGLQPLILGAKEGLAMVNGTQVSTALGVKNIVSAENILKVADIIGAVSVEASLASRAVFQRKIHQLKKHKGQQQSAMNVWNVLKESAIVDSHQNCDKVQDPYSFRCIPHIHGASREIYRSAKELIENEMNSVSDNPLIFSENEVRTSGHFHAEVVAQAIDILAISMAEIGAISERRIHYLMKGIDGKIPMFVASDPGLESGFMMGQVTAAALASENKTLAHPAAVDSISTSAGQEDIVSMAPWSGRKCLNIIENVTRILAIELYVSTSAIVKFHKGLKPGIGTTKLMNVLKKYVKFTEGDHPLYADIEVITRLIRGRKIVNILEELIDLE